MIRDPERLRKDAEASSLSRTGTSILKGNRVKVNWIPEEDGQLGYTGKPVLGKPIGVHVAWHLDPYFADLDDTEATMLRMGVFAHEILHQCLTNFDYTHTVVESMSQAEAAIFMQFANTLEDPAIEYFAPCIFGGKLLDALRFSIKRIYVMSPGIDKSDSAFGQLINALIQFGDMGIIKGTFTFPEAYDYFKKVAPLYNEGITCNDSKRRIDIAKECMEITRPLWEEIVKSHEEFQKLIEKLIEEMEKRGLHLFSEDEKKMSPKGDSGRKERRSSMLKKMEKSSKEKSGEGSKSDDPAEGSKSDDSAEKSENSSGSGSGGNPSDKEEGEESGTESGGSSRGTETGEDGDYSSGAPTSSGESEEGETTDEDPNESSQGSVSSKSKSKNADGAKGSPSGTPDKSDDTDPASESDEITSSEEEANEQAENDEDFEIDEEVLSSIEASLENEEKRLEKEEKAEHGSATEDELPNFDISSSAFKHATCSNKRVKNSAREGLSSLYKDTVSKYSQEIKSLTKSLEQIFKSDREEDSRATSGRYNIMRGTIGTTARIFDKRRDPANLRDTAVFLAVDLSGSMSYGSKIPQARKACIVLAEALTALKIPFYIMGFSADMGANANHIHFIDWRNRKGDRETLLAMDANGNNFDGYSIRYASEVLKAKAASNKLLIVISDGEPACNTYSGWDVGIADTINAIKDARKVCTTFGIAVGNGCDPRTLQNMYGKDFIHCEDEKLLSHMLGKKLQKLFAGNR